MANSVEKDTILWQKRLVHTNEKSLRKAYEYASDMPQVSGPVTKCHSCIAGKQTKKPFKSSFKEVKFAGEIAHSDSSQPGTNSINGSKYMCAFLDQYSRYFTIAALQKKYDTAQAYEEFKCSYEIKWFKKVVTQIHTDGGDKNEPVEITIDFHSTTSLYTPECYGIGGLKIIEESRALDMVLLSVECTVFFFFLPQLRTYRRSCYKY